MDNLVETVRQLVAVDTRPGQPNEGYITLLEALAGKKATLRYDYESNGAKLVAAAWQFPATQPSSGKVPLVFVIHTDTVHQAEGWRSDPLTLIADGDQLHGLGTTDMKGGTAALLVALNDVKAKLNREVWLVADGDEETNVLGGPAIRRQLPLEQAEVVIIEPTATLIRCRQKGSMTIKVTCTGAAVHASEATSSVNSEKSAVEKLRLVLNVLREHELGFESADELFWQPTQTVTTIQGGSSINTVAGSAEAILDRRFSPKEKPDEIIAELTRLVQSVDSTAVVAVDFVGGGFSTASDDQFVQSVLTAAQTINPAFALGDRPGWSEGAIFHDLGPTIIAGPGVIGQSHQANEYNSLRSLQEYARLYQRLMAH